MVTQRGIKANPVKIKATLDMGFPTSINEVQRLIGRIVALNRFMSKFAEKSLPFFKMLRKSISSVLVREEEGTQTPIYYVSKGKPEASGRLVKWAIELRTTQEKSSEEEPWILHVDGSSTMQGSGADIVITSPQGENMEFTIKFDFKASNNEAEYEVLVLGMRMA
ncbi:UNVERIFIED_CONTAM: hypothetical protein Slati_0456200 [Sesamum latifolium]|uniref:Reverse transcriptase domain-containing protein n=1 Tax=Sesamum latifolium TaxID=2727402 RepID=A0AAW2XWC5_9LAMI